MARFGGDEFVVILSERDIDKAKSTNEAVIVAEKLRTTLDTPYLLKHQQAGTAETAVEHHCSSSMGVVLFLGHEASPEEMIKRADLAMYQAKADGGNRIRFFEPLRT